VTKMKRRVFFFSGLIILAMAVACSNVSLGNEPDPGKPEPSAQAGNTDLPNVEWPLSFKVSKILELQQREGNPGLGSSIEEKLQGSTLEFSADGTFVYDTTRGVSTLYPVSGKYQLRDNVAVFSGSRTHSYGGRIGDSSVSIEGKIDLSANEPVASLLIKEGTSASTGAYGSRSTEQRSSYSSELLLEPAQ
jgi:hypothetical protein